MIVTHFVRAFLLDDVYDFANGNFREGEPIEMSVIPFEHTWVCQHQDSICADCASNGWDDYIIEGSDARFLQILRDAAEIVSRIPTSVLR